MVHLQIHTGRNIHSGFSLVRLQTSLSPSPGPTYVALIPAPDLPVIPPFIGIPCIEELAEMLLSCLP